jgi:hypothetical protein
MQKSTFKEQNLSYSLAAINGNVVEKSADMPGMMG